MQILRGKIDRKFEQGQHHVDMTLSARNVKRRVSIWNQYYQLLKPIADVGHIRLPEIPNYATNNGHLFYFTTKSLESRDELLKYLNSNGINAIFHYLELHNSPFYKDKNENIELPNCNFFASTLIRLPLYFELTDDEIKIITKRIFEFYECES